jgi:hypothetical protein
MTRRLLLLALPVALVLLGVGALVLWPRAGITRANLSKIHGGMTRTQVEAIFGGPSGDYRTPGHAYLVDYSFGHPPGSEAHEWIGDEGIAVVAFDQNGHVAARLYVEAGEVTFFDRLRNWLGL